MNKIKRITAVILASIISILFTASVSAQQMKMYIREYYVERDIEAYAGIDMLPIADIAGELGYTYSDTDYGFTLSSTYVTYNFTTGDATVNNTTDKWIGLDVVPMILNYKMRIPFTFVTKTLGLSYTWDRASNTIFIESPVAYERVKTQILTPTPTPAPQITQNPTNNYNNTSTGNYIGNRNSYKFHVPTCGYLPASHNRIYYATRTDAINAGMAPCKRCRP